MWMQINEERRIKLVEVLSNILSRLCERNDGFILNHNAVTRFHAVQSPQITIKAYLDRIAQFSNCSEECFVLALIYIDRLILKNRSFLVNSFNVHKLMITSIMLAAKFFDDQYYNNAHFGRVGGVSCKEINLLEIEFLFMINFNLHIETDLYETYNQRLMRYTQPPENYRQQQGIRIAETKEQFYKSQSKAEASNAPVESNQPVEQPAVQSIVRRKFSEALPPIQPIEQPAVQSIARPRSSEPPVISQPFVCSPRRVSPSVVARVRQRCTPPSPNFLQTPTRIHMETY